jgi:hypothetical protein
MLSYCNFTVFTWPKALPLVRPMRAGSQTDSGFSLKRAACFYLSLLNFCLAKPIRKITVQNRQTTPSSNFD